MFKASPVIFIWSLLIMASIIVGKRDIFKAFDSRFLLFIIFLFFISFIMYYKKHDFLPALILYTKSSVPGIVFLCMLLRKKINKSSIIKTRKNIFYINPLIKSIVSDYCTISFIQAALICIGFFIVVFIQLLNQPAYFSVLAAILSIGFTGIIESIPRMNWLFYAIVSGDNFKYHVKKTVLFLTAFFAILLIPYLFIIVFFNLHSFIKNTYIVVVLLLLSIHVSFTMGNILFKGIGLMILTAITIWINYFNAYLLLLLIIPLVITFLKAKNEYRDWYLL